MKRKGSSSENDMMNCFDLLPNELVVAVGRWVAAGGGAAGSRRNPIVRGRRIQAPVVAAWSPVLGAASTGCKVSRNSRRRAEE
jgi:hypothetical protein